jgi:hypothetical protein
MYKVFYKHILKNILIGKSFEQYKDKKVLNKFHIFPIHLNDAYSKQIYEDTQHMVNTCVVIVKDDIIQKILYIT